MLPSVNRTPPDDRRRQEKIEWIRHRLSGRVGTVQMCGRKAVLAASFELPLQFPRRDIYCVEVAVVTGKIGGSLADSGRRCHSATGLEFPPEPAIARIQRIQVVIGAADV